MQPSSYWLTVYNLAVTLDQHSIPYQFNDSTALYLQEVISGAEEIIIEIQWDLIESTHEIFKSYSPSSIEKTKTEGSFHFIMEERSIQIVCKYNKALRTDPNRIQIEKEGTQVWCQSLYAFLENERYAEVIQQHLLTLQKQVTDQNEAAWNQNNYQALINRYGNPADVAAKIKTHPVGRLGSFYRYMEPVDGKRIAHVMGSNGIKGVALSLLGADVTVIDFSEENAAFAAETATEAGVDLQYVVSDVLTLEDPDLNKHFDIVLMELGVLHYFISLQPLVQVICRLLKPGGRFVLHEFHPISTKLITSKGKKHKVSGNYFDPTIDRRAVAFSKYSNDGNEDQTQVLQRKWTLGELITAVAAEGFVVKILDEEPNQKVHDIGIPKLFTLVAVKPE